MYVCMSIPKYAAVTHYTVHAQAGVSDRTLFAYATINRFLCAFIDHSFADMGYLIQVSPV